MSQPKVLEPSFHEGGKLKSHSYKYNPWRNDGLDEIEITVTSENCEAIDEEYEIQYLTEFEYAGHQYDWEKMITLAQHSIKTSVVRTSNHSYTTPNLSNFEARFILPVVGEEIHAIYRRNPYSSKFTFPEEDRTVKFDRQIYESGYLYLRHGDNFTPIHKFESTDFSYQQSKNRQVSYILKTLNINDEDAMINSYHISKPKKSKQNSFVLDLGSNQIVSEFTTEGKYMKTHLFPSDEERKEFKIPGRGTIRYTDENEHGYVTLFEVYGRAKKQSWFKIGVFNGNGDRFNEVSHKLEEPVFVKELKFVILNCRGSPSMQIKLYQPNHASKPKEPVNKSTVSYSLEYDPASKCECASENRNNARLTKYRPGYKMKHLRTELNRIAKHYNDDFDDFDDFDLNDTSRPKYEKNQQCSWRYQPTTCIKFV